jgi:hypothetical protein
MGTLVQIKKNVGTLVRIKKNMGTLVRIKKNMGTLVQIKKNMGTLVRIKKNIMGALVRIKAEEYYGYTCPNQEEILWVHLSESRRNIMGALVRIKKNMGSLVQNNACQYWNWVCGSYHKLYLWVGFTTTSLCFMRIELTPKTPKQMGEGNKYLAWIQRELRAIR